MLPVAVTAKTSVIPEMVFQQQDTIASLYTYEIPPKPEEQTSIYDYAKVLNGNDRQVLENKLLRYADTTSTQIVIVTIKSLNGTSIGELTPKWAHEWGIGQADKDNGVFILMSELDREIWIAPGYGVDDRLTAGILGQMIRTKMLPEFKDKNYYTGLDEGTDAIFEMLAGKYKANEVDEIKRPFWGFLVLEGIIFFLCLIYHALGGFWAILTAVAMYRGSGKSSGSSRGGGFRGGFGGGGFSGGGAGGKW